jgi:DNA-binding transcriptional LysR family regulator
MRLTLDALLVLDAIDRAGSFAAGAEQLFRVPSAVSYTVHKLEQDLGVTLFDRSGHRARLTPAGAQLLEDGRELLRLAEDVERRVQQVGAGWEARLAIAVGDVVIRTAVYPLLRAFHDAPGHGATHLQVTTEAQATCWETLLAGRADLVIGAPEPGPNVAGFRTRALGEVELALVVPTAHPLARVPEPLAGGVLAEHPVVRQAAWPFDGGSHRGGVELVTVDGYDSQLDAIRHGLGVGYLPAYLVREDVEAGRLVAKAVANAPRLRLAVAWRTAGMGHGLQWFLDRLGDDAVRAQFLPGAA